MSEGKKDRGKESMERRKEDAREDARSGDASNKNVGLLC